MIYRILLLILSFDHHRRKRIPVLSIVPLLEFDRPKELNSLCAISVRPIFRSI